MNLGHSIEFYATAVGLIISVPFLLVLGIMVRQARRHVPADVWLARVMFAYSYVGTVGFIRLILLKRTYVPIFTTLGWLFTSLTVILALYHMREEIRFIPVRRRERRRLERLNRERFQHGSD